LKDHADSTRFVGGSLKPALSRFETPAETGEQAGFADTRRSGYRQQLAFRQRPRHVVEKTLAATVNAEAVYRNCNVGGGRYQYFISAEQKELREAAADEIPDPLRQALK
jgi:hypothetical protein